VTTAREAVSLARSLPSAVVIAHDAGGSDELAVAAEFEEALEIRKVVLTARREPSAHWNAANLVAVESNAVRRLSLLRAVGAAAGRMSEEVETSPGSAGFGRRSKPAPPIAEARAKGRLILVAEDDAINRKVILHQLGMLGHAAEVANDGVEALELWRHGGHGLLLTDLHMPKMDGYTLATTIRSEESGCRLPILALTANALKGEVASARAAGIDEYLTKPMQLHLLGAALTKWLDAGACEARSAQLLSAPASVYDSTVLRGLIGDDHAVVQSFLADYVLSARKLAEDIRHAAKRQDSAKVAACAHKLKSSSRSVGALALGDVCAALENAALTTGHIDLARRCAEFETALAAAMQRLDGRARHDAVGATR
jgi:CheY-like chemotaxis protein/HPt (histidine-containing phosphotransfer) domain-containing protein